MQWNDAVQIPNIGYREVSVVIGDGLPERTPTSEFLNTIMAHAPNYGGWPPWVDLRGAGKHLHPYVHDKGWELLVIGDRTTPSDRYLSFWRIEPTGRLYDLQGFDDDLYPGHVPGEQLDFYLQIADVGEIIATALALARGFNPPADSDIHFHFRWTGLHGRQLTSWTSPNRPLRPYSPAVDDAYDVSVSVPLDTPISAIAPYVQRVVVGLFALFGGASFRDEVIDGIVAERLRRRR